MQHPSVSWPLPLIAHIPDAGNYLSPLNMPRYFKPLNQNIYPALLRVPPFTHPAGKLLLILDPTELFLLWLILFLIYLRSISMALLCSYCTYNKRKLFSITVLAPMCCKYYTLVVDCPLTLKCEPVRVGTVCLQLCILIVPGLWGVHEWISVYMKNVLWIFLGCSDNLGYPAKVWMNCRVGSHNF